MSSKPKLLATFFYINFKYEPASELRQQNIMLDLSVLRQQDQTTRRPILFEAAQSTDKKWHWLHISAQSKQNYTVKWPFYVPYLHEPTSATTKQVEQALGLGGHDGSRSVQMRWMERALVDCKLS